MIDPREAKFQWGQRVVAGMDLVNDGSYPGCAENALLVAQGTQGEVVQVGRYADTDTPVYLVEFTTGGEQGGCVVGCMEEEIFPT